MNVIKNETKGPKEVGVYIGRFSPIHRGHQKIIDLMISKHGAENVLLVVGSINKSDFRNLFPFHDRKDFIFTLYPDVRVMGMVDLPCDETWFKVVREGISSAFGKQAKPIFYAGARGDVEWLKDESTIILDRSQNSISATRVREILWDNGDASHLIDEKILDKVEEVFKDRITDYKEIDESELEGVIS